MTILSQLDQNTTFKEAFLALKILFGLKSKKAIEQDYQLIFDYFKSEYDSRPFFYDAGRTALFQALKAIKQVAQNSDKDEVLVSSFTCLIVVNAILKAGLKPVFIEVSTKNFNLVQKDLISKTSAKTLAIIVQNTFGFIDDYDFIVPYTKSHSLFLIEDLAHSFGSSHPNYRLGTPGDIAMFSFGSGKILSCSRGGALVANNKKLKKALINLYPKLDTPPNSVVTKHLFKLCSFYIFSKLYFFGGKYILAFLAKLNSYPKILTSFEKNLDLDKIQAFTFPTKLAPILLSQIQNIKVNLAHRKQISNYYAKTINPDFCYKYIQDSSLMGFPLKISKPEKLYKKLLKRRIQLCLEWTVTNITPKDINHKRTKYIPDSCKNAETIAKNMIYLPTHGHINLKKAQKISKTLSKYL